jgi:TolB-like protein
MFFAHLISRFVGIFGSYCSQIVPKFWGEPHVGGVRHRFLGRDGVSSIAAIAVLPFKNLSSEPGSDYFSDGLTDEIIRNLSIIDGLQVRSRTVFQF